MSLWDNKTGFCKLREIDPFVRSCHILLGKVYPQYINIISRDCGDVRHMLQSFYHLEEHGGDLNPTNDADLFVFHYVFLPRINSSLATFASAWNNHLLSTENNLTPLQIYTAYSKGSELFDEVINLALYEYLPNELNNSTATNNPPFDIKVYNSCCMVSRYSCFPKLLQSCIGLVAVLNWSRLD